MLKYHHIGIPTSEPQRNETYLAEFKVHVSGYDTSPYGVEWMRFEPGSPLPELVQKIPHVAFQVERIEEHIEGKQILIPTNSPSPGVRVAFIVDDGAPIEFLEIEAE